MRHKSKLTEKLIESPMPPTRSKRLAPLIRSKVTGGFDDKDIPRSSEYKKDMASHWGKDEEIHLGSEEECLNCKGNRLNNDYPKYTQDYFK